MRFPFLAVYRTVLIVVAIVVLLITWLQAAILFVAAYELGLELASVILSAAVCLSGLVGSFGIIALAELIRLFQNVEEHLYKIERSLRQPSKLTNIETHTPVEDSDPLKRFRR